MENVNLKLKDAIVWQRIKGVKDSDRIYAELLKITKQLRSEALRSVADALVILTPETVNPARLARALKPLANISGELFDDVYQTITDRLAALAQEQSASQYQAITSAIPADAAATLTIVAVSPEQISAAALSRPMQGRLIGDWIKGLASDTGYKSLLPQVENAVRQGVLQGKTYSQIAGGIDSVVNGVEMNIRSIVTTAVSHIQAEARDATYDANEHLFNGYSWHSTLDNHTTPICQFRDNTLWHKVKGGMECVTPGKTKAKWLNGPGKAHWGCRSVKVPVVKSWRELGINLDEVSEGTRASMDGQVPAAESFGDWIGRQISKAKVEGQEGDIAYARLEDLYGITRARQLVEGKLKFPDLFTADGNSLKPVK